MGARSMSNTFDKLSVLDSFIEEVNSYLPEIETNLERLSQTPGDMEALEETYRRTHTIGGSASMMDFPGLSHVAHGMEDILGDVLDGLAELDQPTIGLLQRSLERMHRLVDGIHHGIDEDAVIAEDDADYAQYRVLLETAARAGTSRMPGEGAGEQFKEAGVAASPALSMPSIDEVLASFRTPAAGKEEVILWPEEPAAVSYADVPSKQDSQPLQSPSQEFVQDQPQTPAELAQLSALEILEAVLRQSRGANESLFAKAYNEMHAEARVLEEQASSLKRTLTQLRLAVSIIEAQRIEFRSFLDGSKDALDRMEEWAGKAMGLNLRNSPEQVRRYLPLSVMWVANTKLKKVLELLVQMTSGVEMTDEQMHAGLRQLHSSIEACGDVFERLQSSSAGPMFTYEPGWKTYARNTNPAHSL